MKLKRMISTPKNHVRYEQQMTAIKIR